MLFFDDENRNIQSVKMACIIIFLIIIIKISFFSHLLELDVNFVDSEFFLGPPFD
jgi:hypothetical protein